MSQLGGAILMAIGILIAGLTGLCSLSVLFSSGDLSGLQMWPLVAVFGGVPFAVGAGITYAGWRVIRRIRRERKVDLDKITDVFE